jgi:hypothetical protein
MELFPMFDCISARDERLKSSGGKWINGVPSVLSISGISKSSKGDLLDSNDYKPDTNFGKLKRIPYFPLQEFMRKHGAI